MGRFLLQAAGGLTLSSVTGGDAKAAGQSQGDGSHPGAGDTRRHQRGRAEHRRHTITNGVDFSMVRGQPCHGLQQRDPWSPGEGGLPGSLTTDTSSVWAVALPCPPCTCELWGVRQILIFWIESSIDVCGGMSETLSVLHRARQEGGTCSPAFPWSGIRPRSHHLTARVPSPWAKAWAGKGKRVGVGAGGSLGLSSTPVKVRYSLRWRAVVPGYVPCQIFSVGQGSSMLILLAPERLFASDAEQSALNLAGQPRMEGSAPLSLSGEAWIGLPG